MSSSHEEDSTDSPPDFDQAMGDPPPDYHTSVYVVLEHWIPEDGEYSGNAQVLHVFWDLEEANQYAKAYVEELERRTRAPEQAAGEGGQDYEHVFGGTYSSTAGPRVSHDGTTKWTVCWDGETRIKVVKELVQVQAAEAVTWVPEGTYTDE